MEALSTAAGVMKTKVITAPDDKVGVLLYGVKEKQNPNNFDGIRLLHDLDRPSAQRIKELEQEASRTPKQMEERYGCGRPTPVSDVFWTSTTIFNLGANQAQFDCRIFLFTCNDAPAASADEAHAARTRVQDLMDMGVEIEFFPLQFEEKEFSIDRFWGGLLPVDPMDYVTRATLRLEQLERRIRMRIHRKRTLQRLTFYVCPGIEASVSVFVTLLEAKVPAPIYLLNENNKPLKAECKQICEQTGALLHPVDDIETYVEVAGHRILVSRAEAMEAKHFGDPGLRLLGFKPSSLLKDHHRIFHAYFVYPNEKGVRGSAVFLSALISSLLERKLMAVCSYVARKNSEPMMVALLPQAELEEEGEQLRPPGFVMIRLPWAEEIRSLSFPLPDGVRPVPDELKAAAAAVVNALRLDNFAPGCAENPKLQRHYAAIQEGLQHRRGLATRRGLESLTLKTDGLVIGTQSDLHFGRPVIFDLESDVPDPERRSLAAQLHGVVTAPWPYDLFAQALALQEEQPEETTDVLQPDAATLAKKKPIIEAWKEAVTKCAPKRAADVAEGRAAKYPKREVQVPEGVEAMRALLRSGDAERLTVAVLRDWLKNQGVANTGKKQELLERVRSCV
eukprot:s898_g6.t3